jgi:4'-phosphopantetheinyl transferase
MTGEIGWLSQREADAAPGLAWLAPGERDRLAGMKIAKRRADFALGRWTAKRAIAAWLARAAEPPPLDAIAVRAADDGAPRHTWARRGCR